MRFFIDSFHQKGHTACSAIYDSYTCSELLFADTQMAETRNYCISYLKGAIRSSGMPGAMLLLTATLAFQNRGINQKLLNGMK